MSSAIALPLEVSFSGKSSGSGGEPRPCPSHPPHARLSKDEQAAGDAPRFGMVRKAPIPLDAPSPPVISMYDSAVFRSMGERGRGEEGELDRRVGARE